MAFDEAFKKFQRGQDKALLPVIETQREFLRTEATLESRRRRDALKALERRRDWLARRIAENPQDTAMDFLRGEKNALDYALAALRAKDAPCAPPSSAA